MIPGFFGGEARLTWYRIIGRRAGDNWLSPGAVVALEPLQPQLRGALAESSRENCSHLQVRTIATCTTGAHMVTTERAVKRTYEDYCATPDDKRYELLNGDLMMVPAPNMRHQRVLARLGAKLRQFTEEHGLGELFFAPCDVVLSDTDVVQPDLLFISRAREHTITDENVRGASDLVIEILSPATADRDLGYKHDLYGRHGVLE